MPPRPPPSDPRRAAESAPDFLLHLLDGAEESGEVDARQLADALGLTTAGLRRALAEPAALSPEHVTLVGDLLGVDAGVIRSLRRRSASQDAAAALASGLGVDPRRPAQGVPTPPVDASIAALLERVLLAVEGDAVGCALRAGVLDAVVQAARAAGRPLPPAAHELRARLVRGAGGNDGVGGGRGGAAADVAPPDPVALAAAAAGVVRELQCADAGYDGLFAPMADESLDRLLGRFGVVAHDALGVGATARFALTPALFGRHRLVRTASAMPDQRRLAARAALAHLAAGHVSEARPLTSPAAEDEARLADTVALADLVPFWLMADLRRRGRLGWRALTEHVAGLAARAAGDWRAERALERATLRVALFRAHDL